MTAMVLLMMIMFESSSNVVKDLVERLEK